MSVRTPAGRRAAGTSGEFSPEQRPAIQTPVSSQYAISVEAVSKSFGAERALDQVSLHVSAGSLVSILGPSGAGKTTLLQCVAGFAVPDSGRVFVGGRDVTWQPPNKRNLGIVFQSHALFRHMRVRDNVGYGLKIRRVGRSEATARVRECLELVGLAQYEDRYPRQLSGGQQQRVALARALVINPFALLLDEPLSSLDRALRDELRAEIRRVQCALAIPALFVTHDQEEALAISDEVAVMRDGRIEQLGTPTELYDQPATRFIARFLGAGNVLDGELDGSANAGYDAFHWRGHRLRAVTASPTRPNPQIATAAGLMLKPDALTFTSSDITESDRETIPSATVSSIEFLGQANLVTCDCHGQIIRVRVPRGKFAPSPGETHPLYWSVSSGHIVVDDGVTGDAT